MPKVPEHRWKESLDHDSEEHAPTMEEIEADDLIRRDFSYDLQEIEDQLDRPSIDPSSGQENRFGATDPEVFWETLERLKAACNKIGDHRLKNELKNKILETSQRVYKQFIPFIESQIRVFGWRNSPLEEHWSSKKLNAREIEPYFNQARSVLKNFKVPEQELVDFLNDLDRLQEKLEQYQREPTLFTFEKIEEELHKEIFSYQSQNYYIEPKEPLRTLDDRGARDASRLKFDLLLSRAHMLVELAGRMLNGSIQTQCARRSKYIFEHIEYLKEKSDAPRELLTLEAELKDCFQRAKEGEKMNVELLDKIGRRLSEIKKIWLGQDNRKIIGNLEKLFAKTKRAFAGVAADENESFFHAQDIGMDWAWILLGARRDTPEDGVRRAYHRLARKYHPDFRKKEDATEKMRKINEAFELVKRVGGW